MVNFRELFRNKVYVEIISADIAAVLHCLTNRNIEVFNVSYVDDLRVSLEVKRENLKYLHKNIARYGEITVIKDDMNPKTLLNRPVLYIGIIIILTLSLWVSNRVFFVRVEGNTYISERLIIEKAEQCGLHFGALRKEVRSEKIKNALIAEIPELRWVGINTAGCIATIHVAEEETSQQTYETPGLVSSVVAIRDGVIVSGTVYKGNPLFRVGQAVKAGELLVSGYTDCGAVIQATQASAEIIAQTHHTIHAVTPSECIERGDLVRKETKYSLLIGKKLINFFKGSGICDSTCVKIYKEDYMTLPGGLRLPVALLTETTYFYDAHSSDKHFTDSHDQLKKICDEYLLQQIVAGQIISSNIEVQDLDNVICLLCTYSCLEMIGQVKIEENLLQNGKYL